MEDFGETPKSSILLASFATRNKVHFVPFCGHRLTHAMFGLIGGLPAVFTIARLMSSIAAGLLKM